MTADSSKPRTVVLYDVKRSMSEKEALLPTKRIFWDCCRNVGRFLGGVGRVKRFVNVFLHCIVSHLKRISKMSTLPHPGKIYADAHRPGLDVYFVVCL